ncbi:hypothetical protein AKO1_011576, partial [Acrasis kona]
MFTLPILILAEILSLLIAYWSVKLRSKIQFSQERSATNSQFVLIEPHRHKGFVEIVPLLHRPEHQDKIVFEYQKRRYVYDQNEKVFKRTRYPYEVQHPTLGYFRKLSSKDGSDHYSTHTSILSASDRYGLNKFDIPIPKFFDLFKEH